MVQPGSGPSLGCGVGGPPRVLTPLTSSGSPWLLPPSRIRVTQRVCSGRPVGPPPPRVTLHLGQQEEVGTGGQRPFLAPSTDFPAAEAARHLQVKRRGTRGGVLPGGSGIGVGGRSTSPLRGRGQPSFPQGRARCPGAIREGSQTPPLQVERGQVRRAGLEPGPAFPSRHQKVVQETGSRPGLNWTDRRAPAPGPTPPPPPRTQTRALQEAENNLLGLRGGSSGFLPP